MSRGAFIVIDGIDGCGKTTQVGKLEEALKHHRKEVIRARDPGGTYLGEKIRNILLNPETGDISQRSEFLLFLASRMELLSKVIRPAVEDGMVVLGDRFMLSTIVYQGVVGGIGPERVIEISNWLHGGVCPDLSIFLKVSPEVSMGRTKGVKDRIESRGDDYVRGLDVAFRDWAPVLGFLEIDGERDEDAVHQEIVSRVLHVCAKISDAKTNVFGELDRGMRFKSSW